MGLALLILLLVFLTNALSWIGHTVLLNALYLLYSRIFNHALVKEESELFKTITDTKKTLAETSAQEEFAKWAKLRRRLDKALSDLDKLKTKLNSSKSRFSIQFNSVLWFATTGAQFVLVWWYRREPVFYLPPGWFGPLSWFLSLPSAPAGSVSCAVWQMACQRVLKTGERFVKEMLENPTEAANPKKST